VRALSVERRDGRTSLELGLGNWTAVRFDGSGHVIDRREVGGGPGIPLETEATVSIGGVPFLVLSGGELDGWAIRDDARHAVRPIEDAADSAD
jgi:hypothetical protein